MNFRPEQRTPTADLNLITAQVVDQRTGVAICFCQTFDQAEMIAEALISYTDSRP